MHEVSLFENPIAYYAHKWYRHKYNHARFPEEPVIKRIKGVRFSFDCQLSPLVKKMYIGAYERHVVKAIRRHLKRSDIYLDIGANIGYTAAIAATRVGTRGQVHCFEASNTYFEYLRKFKQLNPDYNIIVNNIALGDKEEVCRLVESGGFNIGLNSMVPGFIKPHDTADSYPVNVRRLDNYLLETTISHVALIKIDTEGYELQVLEGASEFFARHKRNLPLIIIEVNPPAYSLMNRSVEQLENIMLSYGYNAYSIDGRRKNDIKEISLQEDVLFKPLAS